MIKSLSKIFTSKRFRRMQSNIEVLNQELDAIRSRIDISDDLYDKFQEQRKSSLYENVYNSTLPLVTVCIGTYNRGELLVERSLKSVLAQTYTNLEVIVVGDCCTDNTEELMNNVNDKRVQFVNLSTRGNYPDDPKLRWMVAGTSTVNHALSLATGDFITHLDDDDEYLIPDSEQEVISLLFCSFLLQICFLRNEL